MKVQLKDIKGMEKRVRKSQTPEKLEELSDSIKELGVVVPIKVRKNGTGYTLVYGHRRVAAAKMAGLTEIEAIIEDVPEDALLTQALAENVIREDMPAIDIAKALAAIIDETGCTQEALGKKMGWAGQTVGSYLGMLAPELKSLARGIDHHHVIEAKAGTGGDLKLAARVLEKAGAEGLSTRQTRQVADAARTASELGGEELVKQVLAKPYEMAAATPLLEASESIKSQGRKPTTREILEHFEWISHPNVGNAYDAFKVIDLGIRTVVSGDERAINNGAAVLKQWRGYLETLVRVVDKAIEKVGDR